METIQTSIGTDGLVEMVAGKLHGLRVTECMLNYHGSITIDIEILEAGHILPLEFVNIWNKASGARIRTYVLPGKRGTGVVCLNGAAARTCQIGDEIIISSTRYIPESALARPGYTLAPRVVMFSHEQRVNTISELLEYRAVFSGDSMNFEICPVQDK